MKTPFDLGWDYSILGAGKNLLKISVTNKIEKQIVFEGAHGDKFFFISFLFLIFENSNPNDKECSLNSDVLSISTVYETPKILLSFNGTYTKVSIYFVKMMNIILTTSF